METYQATQKTFENIFPKHRVKFSTDPEFLDLVLADLVSRELPLGFYEIKPELRGHRHTVKFYDSTMQPLSETSFLGAHSENEAEAYAMQVEQYGYERIMAQSEIEEAVLRILN